MSAFALPQGLTGISQRLAQADLEEQEREKARKAAEHARKMSMLDNFTARIPELMPDPGMPQAPKYGVSRAIENDLEVGKRADERPGGTGGPEKPAPWANDPVVGEAPPASAAPWANDPVVGEAEPDPSAVQAQALLGSLMSSPQGAAIMAGLAPELKPPRAPAGYHVERDPLSKEARWTLAPGDAPGKAPAGSHMAEVAPGVQRIAPDDPSKTDTPQDSWLETNVAKPLEAGTGALSEMVRGARPKDLATEVASTFTVDSLKSLPMLFRDPAQFVEAVDPGHQAIRANNAFAEGLQDLGAGRFDKALEHGGEFLMEGSNAAMGIAGARAAPGGIKSTYQGVTSAVDRLLPGASERAVERAARPVLDAHAETLAAVIADAPVRPQALDAIVRILQRSDIPNDRIEAGLRRVVDVAKEPAGRPATVAQLLQREFGEEFPKVVDNLHVVIRERGLSKKKGDGSATTVLNTTQEMRGSQTEFLRNSAVENLDGGAREVLPDDFLASSARRNFGMTARERLPDDHMLQAADRHFGDGDRLGTWKDADENRRIIGEEGYEPILRTPIDDHLAERITEVLHGPGMGELMTPLRQLAAGMGRDVNTMIQEDPLRAAHWVQHKARLLAEQATAKENGTLATAYTDMRGRILDLIDPLSDPATPNYTYRHAREEYGDEVGRQISTTFGNRFLSQAMDPMQAGRLKDAYADLTPPEKTAALQSVRDALKKQLGMQRPGAGPSAILSRPMVLQQLENVFGEPGKAFADDMRGFIAHDEAFRFGDGFLSKAADELGAGDMKRTYAGMSPAEKSIALQSARDAILRNINQSGANGTSILRRPVVLQQLEEVFGEPGKAFAGDVRRLMSHEQAFKFGDEFLYKAADDFQSAELKKAFEGFSESDKRSALQSTRDAVIRQLNMGRPGGGAPIAILGRTGVLHQLEEIFGAQGKALADDIRKLVGDIDPATGGPVKAGHIGENAFLKATTNHQQSATIPNNEALKEGPALYGSDIANSVPATLAADGAMMFSGMSSVPLLTTMRHGPGALQKLFTPRTKTREDMTKVLMARQRAGRTSPETPPASSGPADAGGGGVDPGAAAMFGNRPVVSPEERALIWDDVLDEGPDPTPIRHNGMFANPVGFRDGASPKKGNPPRVDFEPRDLILARNERDGTYRDTGMDLGMDPEDVNVTETIRALVHRTRKTIETAKSSSGGIDELARQWNVTPDELEGFLVRQQKNPNTGRADAALNKAADIIEKAHKAGQQLSLETIVERMHAADMPIAASSLKTLMSKARTGRVGGHAISEAVQARIQALPPLPRGRPYMGSAAAFAKDGRMGHAVEGAAMFGSGAAGAANAQDLNDDGEVSLEERMMQGGMSAFATKTLTGAVRSRMGGKGKASGGRQPNWNAFGGRPGPADHPLVDDYVPDATTANLRKIQKEYIDRGEVPPVFKVFRKPNGQVIAWRGDGDPRGGLSHVEARDALELGNERLEHGTFAGLSADINKLDWKGVSGEGEAPRSVEKMARQAVLAGKDPNDALMDAYPSEIERDLRSLDAMGPDKGIGNYSHRRKLAMEVEGKSDDEDIEWGTPPDDDALLARRRRPQGQVRRDVGWETPDGDALVSFIAAPRPGVDGVTFRLGGRTVGGVDKPKSVSTSEAKAFEKAMSVVEREVIKRGQDVYLFEGATDSHGAFYLRTLRRLGPPQGYVAIAGKDGGFPGKQFALVRKSHFDAEVAAGRLDPDRFEVIASKRGTKEVPEWRRLTGQFAIPALFGAGGAAVSGSQRSDEPRAE